jgi:hypothetical protein
MALGYCTHCDKLVPILERGKEPNSRVGIWYPVEHDTSGARCPGVKKRL